MIMQPEIDPIIFSLGPLHVRWYGVSYLVGFALALWLGRRRAAKPNSGWTADEVSDLIFYSALGLIIGARVGYVFFYQFPRLLEDPLFLFYIWEGGMSFHGGVLGVMSGIAVFAHRYKKTFFSVTDFTVPLGPLGILSGRMGNFINGELWGRPTDVPWCMVFRDPNAGGLCRHPSQLYEGLLEGLLLFVIIWWFSSKKRPPMAVSGLFLVGYASFRIISEFFREPDKHLGFIAFNWLTMGQLLSILMFVPGVILLVMAYLKQQPAQLSSPQRK